MPLTWGNGNADSATAFEKNVNIILKNNTAITNTVGLGKVTANAVQVIAENNATVNDLETVLAAKNLTNYYYIKNSGDAGIISFRCDEDGNAIAGTFNVAEGSTTVAVDSEGNVVAVSDNGVLDLTGKPGSYDVRIVEQYDNDGTTLTVYEPGEIDLATVSHQEKEGKVFIGWAFSDGTYPSQVAEYKYGDVLTAQYVDYTTEDFAVEMTEMRDDSTEDTLAPVLRFVFSENKALSANMKQVTRAVLMLPTSSSYGLEMYLDEKVIKGWNYDDDNNFTPKEQGVVPNSIVLTNILEENEDEIKYTLCLTNLAKENYDVFYAVRPYIQYQDNNGIEGIFYAKQDVSSLYKTVAEADYVL